MERPGESPAVLFLPANRTRLSRLQTVSTMPGLLKLPLVLCLYRAGVLVVLAVLVHQQARWFDAQRASSISLRVARKFFPTANRVQLRDAGRGLHFVANARGDTIGCLLTTSPQT